MALVDLTGMRFDRWQVEGLDPASGKVKYWFCVCDCGGRKRVFGGDLKRRMSKSCGCLSKESRTERMTTHGMARHPAYRSWINAKGRCENPENDNYPIYGGRGIEMCRRWSESFDAFWEDMGETWQSGLSIDRIDANGNYEADNCRWATPLEQANNRRTNMIIDTPKGPMNVTQAAAAFGMNRNALAGRIRAGWPTEELFTQPRFNMRWHKT